MPVEKFFAVDRVERKHAVLISDSGEQYSVPLTELPRAVGEGAVLRVPVSPTGQPDWPGARVDEVETTRRRAEAEELLRELRRRDPGGDIEL
jgi:hypothetical protein